MLHHKHIAAQKDRRLACAAAVAHLPIAVQRNIAGSLRERHTRLVGCQDLASGSSRDYVLEEVHCRKLKRQIRDELYTAPVHLPLGLRQHELAIVIVRCVRSVRQIKRSHCAQLSSFVAFLHSARSACSSVTPAPLVSDDRSRRKKNANIYRATPGDYDEAGWQYADGGDFTYTALSAGSST